MRRARASLQVCLALAVVAAGSGRAFASAAEPSSGGNHRVTLEELAEKSAVPPTIELFTMGPGALFVEKFGHAALCVRWPQAPQMDVCYNYGTTDFHHPLELGWGFIRGGAEFWVEKWPRLRMIRHYIAKDRTLWVQTFDDSNMPAAQRYQIARKLEFDSRIENRYYQYHHFYDNCTTRVRDIVNNAVNGKLKADTDGYPGPTFREYGAMGFAEETWLIAISDYVMGPYGDIHPTFWQAMFLPRKLRAAVTEKLGVKPKVLYQRKGPSFPHSGSSGRGWTLLFSLLLALPAIATRLLRRRQKLGLAISGSLLGFLGFMLWLVAIVSPLNELRWNEALFLFVPTDFALPFLSMERRRKYARVRLGMVVLSSLLLVIHVFKQPLWIPILTAFPTLLVAALPVPDKDRTVGTEREPASATEVAERVTRPSEKKSKGARRLRRARR